LAGDIKGEALALQNQPAQDASTVALGTSDLNVFVANELRPFPSRDNLAFSRYLAGRSIDWRAD
jgi:hypothetical protein